MSHIPAPALTEASDCRSHSVRALGVACCAYLLVFSGAVLLWLWHAGVRLDAWAWIACALAPAVGLALLGRSTADARQYALNMLAATLMLPILLLFWASSADVEAPAALPDAPSLDAQRLFEGATAIQDADMHGGGITLLRSGQFGDGSELRLTRFTDAAAAQGHLAMLAGAMPTAPFTEGGRRGVRLVGAGIGSTLLVIERHGPDLLELRAADRPGGLARLAAQQVPVPEVERVAAPVEPVARWPFFTAMSLAHGFALVVLIARGGSTTTRVPALRGVAPATPEQLRARLLSLARPTGPFDICLVTEGGSQAVRVDASPSRLPSCDPADPTTHLITLHLDAASACVRVHEKLAARAAAPRNAEQASMRGPGDEWFDPARPDARRRWASTVQATMIVPTRLAAVPLQLYAQHAELPAAHAASLDGEGVVTALCALVTRSGWHWQPRLFGRRV
jgi:hypothetical protein